MQVPSCAPLCQRLAKMQRLQKELGRSILMPLRLMPTESGLLLAAPTSLRTRAAVPALEQRPEGTCCCCSSAPTPPPPCQPPLATLLSCGRHKQDCRGGLQLVCADHCMPPKLFVDLKDCLPKRRRRKQQHAFCHTGQQLSRP